mgnify:CR=1 FL=1
MSIWFDVARVAAGLNVVFLLALGYVWGRNYVELRSKHALGLFMFSAFLLLENLFALYYYLVDPQLSVWFSTGVSPLAWSAMMTLHVLESIGLAFMAWITYD